MPQTASRPVPSLRAAVLDCLLPEGDIVAELRRVLEGTRHPAAELWEKYRGQRGRRRTRCHLSPD